MPDIANNCVDLMCQYAFILCSSQTQIRIILWDVEEVSLAKRQIA
jgi:hypothetical protein